MYAGLTNDLEFAEMVFGAVRGTYEVARDPFGKALYEWDRMIERTAAAEAQGRHVAAGAEVGEVAGEGASVVLGATDLALLAARQLPRVGIAAAKFGAGRAGVVGRWSRLLGTDAEFFAKGYNWELSASRLGGTQFAHAGPDPSYIGPEPAHVASLEGAGFSPAEIARLYQGGRSSAPYWDWLPSEARSAYRTPYDPRFPGRPDPAWSVDTDTFARGVEGTALNARGWPRSAAQFWARWLEMHPETLSPANRALIARLQQNYRGLSPRIDDVWVQSFPEHAEFLKLPFKERGLVHHHVDQGRYAIPVPGPTHRSSGGVWHQ